MATSTASTASRPNSSGRTGTMRSWSRQAGGRVRTAGSPGPNRDGTDSANVGTPHVASALHCPPSVPAATGLSAGDRHACPVTMQAGRVTPSHRTTRAPAYGRDMSRPYKYHRPTSPSRLLYPFCPINRCSSPSGCSNQVRRCNGTSQGGTRKDDSVPHVRRLTTRNPARSKALVNVPALK
jgi:hypothetical protein